MIPTSKTADPSPFICSSGNGPKSPTSAKGFWDPTASQPSRRLPLTSTLLSVPPGARGGSLTSRSATNWRAEEETVSSLPTWLEDATIRGCASTSTQSSTTWRPMEETGEEVAALDTIQELF